MKRIVAIESHLSQSYERHLRYIQTSAFRFTPRVEPGFIVTRGFQMAAAGSEAKPYSYTDRLIICHDGNLLPLFSRRLFIVKVQARYGRIRQDTAVILLCPGVEYVVSGTEKAKHKPKSAGIDCLIRVSFS